MPPVDFLDTLTTDELLERLAQLGVHAQADGDQLRVNAPKGVLTPDLRDQIAARKDALLAAMRQAHRPDEQGPALTRQTPYPDRLPLSFAQQRLWFLEQLEISKPYYHIPGVYRLRGPLNQAALERALLTILDRHESLRTRFELVDGQPVQVIGPAEGFSLPLTDLTHLPAAEREPAGRAMAAAEVQRPFDFRADFMLRTALLRLAADEHWLVVVMHHIASDGWSMGVFWSELNTLYHAETAGHPASLPLLPVQYADYTLWQRAWLQDERLAGQLAYWREQLAGLAPQELPTDHPRPETLSYRAGSVSFQLDLSQVERLRALCRQEGVTLYMALLAAFAVLLQRYMGQDDVAVGAPIAGRRRTELEPLIGFFVNTLVMRVDLSGQPSVRELLRRVRRVALDAYDHQDIPFEKVVEEFQPERHLNRSPLVQALFQVHNTPTAAPTLPGLAVERLRVGSGMLRFDLEVALTETTDGLTGHFSYTTDLFEASTIQRMVEHYLNALDQIVADPDAPVDSVSLLTEAERRQILEQWNATEVSFPPQAGVHRLVEAQVARTPDAPAIIFGDQVITYRDLDGRANRLARYLQAQGVGPDVPVGLYLSRSPELMVALLGVLKGVHQGIVKG